MIQPIWTVHPQILNARVLGGKVVLLLHLIVGFQLAADAQALDVCRCLLDGVEDVFGVEVFCLKAVWMTLAGPAVSHRYVNSLGTKAVELALETN